MDVLIFQVSNFTIQCINALIFHVSSFTIYYMNALVIKASLLYILKQMPHVSICFRFSSLCLWKKKQSFEQQNLQSVHITVFTVYLVCETCSFRMTECYNFRKYECTLALKSLNFTTILPYFRCISGDPLSISCRNLKFMSDHFCKT